MKIPTKLSQLDNNIQEAIRQICLERGELHLYLKLYNETITLDEFQQILINQKQTMEKQIKMSLETARKFYLECKDKGWDGLMDWLLENFTKEELEGKKGFTWEDSFSGDGWYLHNNEQVRSVMATTAPEGNKNVFRTKEQAESVLAFAQLSHIVPMYNEGKSFGERNYAWNIQPTIEGKLTTVRTENNTLIATGLCFISLEDAETSLNVNNALWKQHWMIN